MILFSPVQQLITLSCPFTATLPIRVSNTRPVYVKIPRSSLHGAAVLKLLG